MRTLLRIRLFKLTIPVLAVIISIVGVIILAQVVLAGGTVHLGDSCYFRTEDGSLVASTRTQHLRTPAGVILLVCDFPPDTYAAQQPHVVANFLCKSQFGDTYFSKAVIKKDGSFFFICHWNGSPHVYPDPSVTPPSSYRPPLVDLPGHNDGSEAPGHADDGTDGPTSTGDAEPAGDTPSGDDGAGGGDTPAGDAGGSSSNDEPPKGPVQGAGGSYDPPGGSQGGDNGGGSGDGNGGGDSGGGSGNGNGNGNGSGGDNNNGAPPDQSNSNNHDGIDKDNGNGNGNNGNGHGNGGPNNP